jgi:hypothetical protein
MACPICGRMMCDHGPAERGQTVKEMMSDYQADVLTVVSDSKKKGDREKNKE